jgi:hypothetical protein
MSFDLLSHHKYTYTLPYYHNGHHIRQTSKRQPKSIIQMGISVIIPVITHKDKMSRRSYVLQK